MEHEHYPLWYRLDGADRYLIWYSMDSPDDVDRDGVLLDAQGRIPVFAHIPELRAYAERHGVVLASGPQVPSDDELLLHDLDTVQEWLRHPRKHTVDCVAFLSAWNLFGDVARSAGDTDFDRDQSRTENVYAKLFCGNNLPALTPPGRHYEPLWTKSEVGRLSHVLGCGVALFRSLSHTYATSTLGAVD